MAELQPDLPYTCQMRKLEEKQKFPNLKYSFDITKEDEFFYVLLKDKQFALSCDNNNPSFEQRNGNRYCKLHNVI